MVTLSQRPARTAAGTTPTGNPAPLLVDALVPGMPAPARAAVTGQAQGIPLFAVETIRSLIDRDIVQSADGVYRLVKDVGELAVPEGLHALLAARLDALEPGVRRLAADAATPSRRIRIRSGTGGGPPVPRPTARR